MKNEKKKPHLTIVCDFAVYVIEANDKQISVHSNSVYSCKKKTDILNASYF